MSTSYYIFYICSLASGLLLGLVWGRRTGDLSMTFMIIGIIAGFSALEFLASQPSKETSDAIKRREP